MPGKKGALKGGAPVARIRENPGVIRAREVMGDYINRRSLLDVFTSVFFSLDPRNVDEILEDEMYSDEDDNDFYPYTGAYRAIEPHPRIRQLTDEEAEKHAKEQTEEEEKRKVKAIKNKYKKLRKKEKKRLEKENEFKAILAEEVSSQGKSKASENCGENTVIESDTETNEPRGSGETHNAADGCDGRSGITATNNNNGKEEDLVKMATKEDEEKMMPAGQSKEKNKKFPGLQQSKEKPKVVKNPEVQVKEKTQESNVENTIDPIAEEFAKTSRKLAGIGHHLAASGQYEMAVKYFTDAIKYNPKEFKLFGNRSLCYERMQLYENACRDADLALSIEPKWIKGLFRKGKALCGLKRYYEASLIYKEVLKLDSLSSEAKEELKQAQTLHLMEMGFTWAESSSALQMHETLEEAVESLFGSRDPGASTTRDTTSQPVVQEEDGEGEWIVQQTRRPRKQQRRGSAALGQIRSTSQSPTPCSRHSVKPRLFSVWVGSLAPAVTYTTLHELFSRAGTVYSIKMLLEQQCAFVNYTGKEDCDVAIQCINGMVVEGAPLAVRYPSPALYTNPGPSKECFFWRTTGCTRLDCTYKHYPMHKGIDRDKFTSRLGNFHK